MTRKTNKAVAFTAPKQKKAQQQPKPKKSKPFSETGSIIGNAIGSMFGNAKAGKGIGRFLGSGIGSIFGSGDYTLMGAQPTYNVLTNSTQIPKFESTKQANIVCHREYLGDINGTLGFNNVAYPLNPGMAQTFPWLAGIASNYQEYVFHGLIFEFRPLITDFVTNGAPGVVVMATNYNADVPIYTTKQEMENSEYAVSVKPTNALIHGVECAPAQTVLKQRYVRSGSVPSGQDLRLYDYGNFQFATQANPVQDLGELWVSYCVEFLKPVLPNDINGNINSGHLYRTGVVAGSPFGANTFINSGSLAIVPTTNSISFLGAPGQSYSVTLSWVTTGITGIASSAYVGAIEKVFYGADTTSRALINNGNNIIYSTVLQCTLLNPGMVTMTISSLLVTGTGSIDIFVTESSTSVIA